MAGLIFWDVDTQYDSMGADGKHHVPGAEEIIPARPGTGLPAVTDAMEPTEAGGAAGLLRQRRERGVDLITTEEAVEMTQRPAAPAQAGAA